MIMTEKDKYLVICTNTKFRNKFTNLKFYTNKLYSLSLNEYIPGSLFPSSNSNEAPPPVDT
jgi:hypothetical protein